MKDTSTKVFTALCAIARIVFNTGYNKAKYQKTISIYELNQKKHECDISWDKVKTDKLREDAYKNIISLNEQGDIITIKRDSFECTFEIHSIFELVAKFARLAREEKSISNAVIKQYTTLTYIGSAATTISEPESKVEQAKPVVLTIKVEQEQPKQTDNNPYNSDYVAMLAAQLSKLMSNYSSVPF